MIKNKFIWMLGLTLAITSCDVNNELPEIEAEVEAEETVALNAGSADFSNYIAVGASFTAGFTDGALFIAGQEDSFPNTLATKFAMIGGGDFNQPLMNDNIGGLLYGGTQIQEPRFYFDGAGPARLPATPTTETTTPVTGTINNYGIPGAKSFHLVTPGLGSIPGVLAETANPYFARFASSDATTVLTDAVAQSPTFFTLSEVGGNDVLGYALDGGAGEDQTGNFDAATYGSEDITDPLVFASAFGAMVDALTANGAKGVVSNVPYITSLANFTTVPYNPVPLDADTAALVNAGFAEYNAGLQLALSFGMIDAAEVAERTVVFVEGDNAVTIQDEYLTDLSALGLPSYRQATADDLLVLAGSAFIGTEVNNNATLLNGVTVPLSDEWVLTPEEQEAIKTATDAYNTTIANIAASNSNIVMVDLNSVLTEAATTGVAFDGYNLTTGLVTGGLISLDGVHLTARGYALMANKILEEIDTEFGSNFAEATDGLAKADDFPTNYSPTLQ